MPVYEYECPQCGKKFEKLQGMHDRPSVQCPDCGVDASRLISGGAAVISKGRIRRHEGQRPRSNCARESPCCGSDTPCEKKPCDE